VLLNDSYHMITVDRERDQVVARSIEHISRFASPKHSSLQRAIPQPAQTRMQA